MTYRELVPVDVEIPNWLLVALIASVLSLAASGLLAVYG